MSHATGGRSAALRLVLIGVVAWTATAVSANAQEMVSISVPAGIDFPVTDVSRSTAGSPNPTILTFSNATLNPGRALRVSVQADTSTFTPPSGARISASNVSWAPVGAAGGIGWNGTLSSSSYALVFLSDPGVTSGHVDLEWALSAPGSGIRAGMHQLTIHWKLEAITP